MAATAEFIEKFWEKVDKSGECWLWTGWIGPSGYGCVWRKGSGIKTLRAHRVAYELSRGPVPQGLQLDHLCRNRACVNPDHLEPVTAKVNNLRGIGVCADNARKTHCKRGHPLTADNLSRVKYGRICKQCALQKAKDYQAKHGRPKAPSRAEYQREWKKKRKASTVTVQVHEPAPRSEP